MDKILGVIITYEPDDDIIDRINNLHKQLDFLIVYDNSVKKELRTLFKKLNSKENIMLISNRKNLGVGKGLNFAVKYALKNNFKYLLTSDQDTDYPDNYVRKLLFIMKRLQADIVGPLIFDENRGDFLPIISKVFNIPIRRKVSPNHKPEKVFSLITSGSLYNVDLFKNIGFFKEEFFIDYIDIEFCLRANSLGKKVMIIPGVWVKHRLGYRKNNTSIKLFNLLFPTNYSEMRRYYITRNRFFVYREYFSKYPFFVLYDFTAMLLDMIRILLFENNKEEKFKNILLGIFDAIKGNFRDLGGFLEC